MVDFGTYEFKNLKTGEITLEKLFANYYTGEVYESENVHTDTKQLRVILDAKYENAYLHKVMETKCQYLTKNNVMN